MFRKMIKKLKGKELAEYIRTQKSEFQGNGDDLCVSAGYGRSSEDGGIKCDLPLFMKELSKVSKYLE